MKGKYQTLLNMLDIVAGWGAAGIILRISKKPCGGKLQNLFLILVSTIVLAAAQFGTEKQADALQDELQETEYEKVKRRKKLALRWAFAKINSWFFLGFSGVGIYEFGKAIA